MISSNHLWFLPLLLYAETHYRFKYFFSLLKKKEPELLADAPHRVDPSKKIPLLFLAKDAHLYPCELLRISITVSQKGIPVQSVSAISKPIKLNEHWWWRVFFLNPHVRGCWIDIDVTFTISVHGKTKSYKNDNYRSSSHRSLRVYVSESPLPKTDNLLYGDCHTHSSYTEDQVEFGSPISASVALSAAMGLSFFSVTDHSYDVDDLEGNYLRNDPSILKWNKLQKEVSMQNHPGSSCFVIRGEEVSCRNTDESTVHLLVLGERTFFHGGGDGAERWFRTRSEHSVRDITSFQKNVATFAAHPQEFTPFLQRVLLGRGQWDWEDLLSPGLHGIQFLNGTRGGGFRRGKELWKRSLLLGLRLIAIAGNDAHGNFNNFRQLGIPFVHIREASDQIFGKMRTGVFVKGRPTEAKILGAIVHGNAIITDGPAATLLLLTDLHRGEFGDKCEGTEATAQIRALSSPEFGKIETVRVIRGIIGKEEDIISEGRPLSFEWEDAIPIRTDCPIYLRIELATSNKVTFDGLSHFCMTNPIWLSPPDFVKKKPLNEGAF